jgi:ABC-type bacteriocin/lantibiotic exporter with double-glycine peptidase domain
MGFSLMCRFRGVFRSTLLLVPVFLFVGCSQRLPLDKTLAASNEAKIIENVPFVKQKDRFCGPAAMVSVMRFYGRNISQEEVAKEVYTPKLGGALISDMEYFAREMGYKAETKNGDLNAVISVINEGIPLILIVDLGKWVVSVPHYYVVYGYNKNRNTFLLHSGFKKNLEMSFSELDKEWEKMNRLMLVVRK